MIDILLLIGGAILAVLAVATSYAAWVYYSQLRAAQNEYEKARGTVEEVVMSFNRELNREAERIEAMSFRIEGATAQAEAGLRKAASIEEERAQVESKVDKLGVEVVAVTKVVGAISESNNRMLKQISSINADALAKQIGELESSQEKFSGVGTRVQDLETVQEALKAKLESLEVQLTKLSISPESRGDSILPVSVMPIKRDKAMSSLTNTEVSVLEFLTSEGPKTAPEIKEKVQLSREHTARLMKKLYEEGYLERETGKLPFRYTVKKEMEKLLKKPETTTS